MSLYDTLLVIQYITILGFFILSILILSKWRNTLHTWLFLSCIAELINNIGYLLEFTSKTEEALITAVKFSYMGRAWYAFFLFLFVAQLVRVKLPGLLKKICIVVHALCYVVILTLQYHKLYYSDIRIVSEGSFLKIYHENGIVHHFFMSLQIVYILLGIAWLTLALRKEKSRLNKRRLGMVLLAVVTESLFFVIQIIGIHGLTDVFDVTLFGYFIGLVIMLIAVFSCDLLGTSEIAKEFVIDRISEGIIAVDNDGVVQYFNEPAEKLCPANEMKNFLTEMAQAAANGQNITLNNRIYTPEENELIYEGEKVGRLYALVDDTEHYQYMEELQKQKEIADRANEAKGRFLANMSHEIRTPINAVLGFDEMILRESKEKEIRSYAADIMSAGRTLLSLINDILDLSKVEEGKMEIIPVQYELSSLINDLFGMIRERAIKKGLELDIDVEEQIPHLLVGDEIRIRQCVLNLLTNAVKYTEKGSVSLTVSFEKKDEGHIGLFFKVEDTGIGMKKEDMEKLFSPYQRIEEKRNRSIEGTGLGMSIVTRLLELMGSRLCVESEYGKGTAVSFTVEQEVVKWEKIGVFSDRLNEIKGEDYSYQELFHAPDARILVVDDTEMNLTVIQNLLKKTQIHIDTAQSGKDALALSAENDYDVIFIDHMMPDMDGIETLRHLKNSEKNKDTPAVALTANAVSGAREMYLEAGFTDYLSKPVDGSRLEKMLGGLLPENKKKHIRDLPSHEADERSSLPDWLVRLKELDTETGLKNCGSEEGYLSVLRVFHQTAAAKADEIEDLYQKGDIENYTIMVHALKSSARIIGAGELSGFAASLERAGKQKNLDYISDNTEELLLLYRALDREMGAFEEPETPEDMLPKMEPSQLKEVYLTILEIAQSMDYELMEDTLKQLQGYQLDYSDKTNIKQIETKLNELDWDSIAQIAGEALKRADNISRVD